MGTGPVYALNLFDVSDREGYLAYVRRSVREVAAHGGRVAAIGKFRESQAGDLAPRQVLILVEWESYEAFKSYTEDPSLEELHARRVNSTKGYIWQIFDRLEDFRPILKNP